MWKDDNYVFFQNCKGAEGRGVSIHLYILLLILRLFVVRGKPEVELPRLFKQWKITKLTFEFDHEPDGRVRDTKISEHASDVGIEVETKICHSLYDLDK